MRGDFFTSMAKIAAKSSPSGDPFYKIPADDLSAYFCKLGCYDAAIILKYSPFQNMLAYGKV